MIRLSHISLAFQTRVLIEDGQIDIPDGNITLLTGESGCGKTTLLMDIGLLSHRVFMDYDFNGTMIIECDEKKKSMIRQNEISFIFQENYLFEHLNLIENIRLFASLTNQLLSDEDIHELLDFVDLDLDFKTSLRAMSGGEKQRLAIVCGIVKDAKLFIFDEPTSYLDEDNKQKIISIIKKLAHNKQKMVIIASHDQTLIDIADNLYHIENQTITCLKSGDYQQYNELLREDPISHKVLSQYVYKKNKNYSLVAGIFLGIFLAGLIVAFVYSSFYQQKDEEILINAIHHYGMITRNDKQIMSVSEQTRLRQNLADFNIFSYIEINTFLKCGDDILNQVVVKPYYDQTIGTDDILKQNQNVSYKSFYASYEIYHYFKEDTFSQIEIPELGRLSIDAILKPDYDKVATIYIPYSRIVEYFRSQDIDLYNTPLQYMIVSISSLEDYQRLNDFIEKPYIITTASDIDAQVRLIQVFNSQYVVMAWSLLFILVIVYQTYRLIGDKRNIALLETLGVNHSCLIRMKLMEEFMLLGSMGVFAFGLGLLILCLLSIVSWVSVMTMALLIVMNVVMIEIINILIFIVFIKKYTAAILFS